MVDTLASECKAGLSPEFAINGKDQIFRYCICISPPCPQHACDLFFRKR